MSDKMGGKSPQKIEHKAGKKTAKSQSEKILLKDSEFLTTNGVETRPVRTLTNLSEIQDPENLGCTVQVQAVIAAIGPVYSVPKTIELQLSHEESGRLEIASNDPINLALIGIDSEKRGKRFVAYAKRRRRRAAQLVRSIREIDHRSVQNREGAASGIRAPFGQP